MNFIEEGPLREKFLRMGRKLGWSDVPNLDDKIAVVSLISDCTKICS